MIFVDVDYICQNLNFFILTIKILQMLQINATNKKGKIIDHNTKKRKNYLNLFLEIKSIVTKEITLINNKGYPAIVDIPSLSGVG